MDDNQTLVAGGVGTAFTVVLLIVYRFLIPLFNVANHKRVRSVCCGKFCVTSLDVEDTTPVTHRSHRGPDVDPGNPSVVLSPIHAPKPLVTNPAWQPRPTVSKEDDAAL